MHPLLKHGNACFKMPRRLVRVRPCAPQRAPGRDWKRAVFLLRCIQYLLDSILITSLRSLFFYLKKKSA